MTNLIENDDLVTSLRFVMSESSSGLDALPELLRCVLNTEAWRERKIKQTGELATFTNFEEFVAAPPLEGLGSSMQQLRDLLGDSHDELQAMLTEIVRRPHGGDRKSEESKIKGDNVTLDPKPDGNSKALALRRLRKDRPDLHAKVIAKEMSPHKAMVEAGFRPHTITIPLDPVGAARVLLRHFNGEQLAILIRSLYEQAVANDIP